MNGEPKDRNNQVDNEEREHTKPPATAPDPPVKSKKSNSMCSLWALGLKLFGQYHPVQLTVYGMPSQISSDNDVLEIARKRAPTFHTACWSSLVRRISGQAIIVPIIARIPSDDRMSTPVTAPN